MSFKESSNSINLITSPPSYESHMPSHTPTQNDSALCEQALPPPTHVTYHEYQHLRRKWKYSLAFNIYFLVVGVPLLCVTAYLLSRAESRLDQIASANSQTNDAIATITPINETYTVITARALPPRQCITGFTIDEIQDGFDYLQKKHNNKARVWGAPCSQVAAVDYTDSGLQMEADYVVVVVP